MLLDDVVKEGDRLRGGSTYANTLTKLRAMFTRQQTGILTQELARRFPRTFQNIPAFPVGLVPHVGHTDATVYDRPPDRTMALAGVPLQSDSPVSAVFHSFLSDCGLDLFLSELESAVAVAGTMFVRIGWDSQRVNLQWCWPCDVYVKPRDGFTGFLESRTVAALVWRGPSGTELWEPVTPTDEATAWRCTLYTEHKGKRTMVKQWTVPLFPWLSVHKTLTNGAPVVPADEDLLASAIAVSVTVTNLADVVDQQTHADRVYKGNKSPQFTGGTSSIVSIGPDEDLTTLSYPTEVEQGRDFADFLVKLLAVTRQQPADAYSTDSRDVLSGVARLIANIPANRAAAKRAALFKDMEQRFLLPTLFHTFQVAFPSGILSTIQREAVQFFVQFQPSHVPETERDKLDRIVTAVDSGLMTRERALVALGYAANEDQARDMLPPRDPFGGA